MFLSSAHFFQNILFSKNYFRYTIRVSNSLDPDQDRHLVGPDLVPDCLQRLSADNKSCHLQGRVNYWLVTRSLKSSQSWTTSVTMLSAEGGWSHAASVCGASFTKFFLFVNHHLPLWTRGWCTQHVPACDAACIRSMGDHNGYIKPPAAYRPCHDRLDLHPNLKKHVYLKLSSHKACHLVYRCGPSQAN